MSTNPSFQGAEWQSAFLNPNEDEIFQLAQKNNISTLLSRLLINRDIKSISKFINRMNKNDLLVFFSDTPPMFASKRRVHFEDLIDVYFFTKK